MAKTVEQIAKALNLSVTTVRLVLNGKAERYRISVKTQEKITGYVKQHGYTVNYIARSLKLNKTDTLGLVIPRLSNPFFAALVEKLETQCRDAGYQLMTSCSYGDEEYENKLVNSLAQRNIDGLFVVSATAESQRYQSQKINKPLVFFDRDFNVEDASCVVSNNYQSAYDLTSAMLTYIEQPIHFFIGDATLPTIAERINGYLQANLDCGYPAETPYVSYAHENKMEDGLLMMERYIKEHGKPPVAFIASSLPILEGMLSVIHQHYGRIPSEFKIGTFDEHVMLSFLANPIWSIRQDINTLVDEGFAIMQNKLQGNDERQRLVVPTELIARIPA